MSEWREMATMIITVILVGIILYTIHCTIVIAFRLSIMLNIPEIFKLAVATIAFSILAFIGKAIAGKEW